MFGWMRNLNWEGMKRNLIIGEVFDCLYMYVYVYIFEWVGWQINLMRSEQAETEIKCFHSFHITFSFQVVLLESYYQNTHTTTF